MYKKLKQSHIWSRAVLGRCPRCGCIEYTEGHPVTGEVVECPTCEKEYMLGKRGRQR